MKMYTGEFQMAPLSDFTVTFISHVKPPKVKMTWEEWYPLADCPEFDLNHGVITFISQKEPEDIEVIFPERDPPYEVIWAK